jgi:predicted component of type VI protein secretion system
VDTWDSANLPRFVVARPARLRGTMLVLGADRLVLGRGANCDLRVEDPHVSLAHAEFFCSHAQTTVRDLGSTNGTLVNGARIAGVQALRHGDVLRFGIVEARFEEPAVSAAPTGAVSEVGSLDLEAGIAAALRVTPAGRHARPDTAGRPVASGSDSASRPYDRYVQQIIAGQANRLHQVATAGSRARRLAAIGFVVFALGIGITTGLLVRLAARVDSAIAAAAANPAAEHPIPSLLGPSIYGVPIGAVGFAAALIGIVIMAAGIVPHLTATSMRRCLEPCARPAVASPQDWPAVPAEAPLPAAPPPTEAQVPAEPQASPELQVRGLTQAPCPAQSAAVERPALPRHRDPVGEVLRRRVSAVREEHARI